MAKEVTGWGEPEIIRLIRHMKRNPHLSASECKDLVMAEAMGELISDYREATKGSN